MPRGAVMREDMIITKITKPNAFAVLNPLRTFSPLIETTIIHTKNTIATSIIKAAYPNMGIISENTFSSSISVVIRYDKSIATIEPHTRNINPDSTTIIGMAGTYA